MSILLNFSFVQPKRRTARSAPLPVVPSSATPIAIPVPADSSAEPVSDTPDHTPDDTLPDTDFDDEDVAWLNLTETNELTQCVNTCVERWRNAGPEACKKMFALFAVAGIFLAVCRHGHVLVICDMIHSGEL